MSQTITVLPTFPPDDGILTPVALETLRTLSALIEGKDANNYFYDDHYGTLWKGLLLGSGACVTPESASEWAGAIRYSLCGKYDLVA
jgi:hypothetical protein